jgi:hypothetical protein
MGSIGRIEDNGSPITMRTTMPIRRRAYDTASINTALEKLLAEIGTERFSAMRLLDLEKLLRTYDHSHELPGKTVLRDAINKFRAARWPAAAPKRMSDRFRH